VKRLIRVGDLKKLLREELLREDEGEQTPPEEGEDSLDAQVDRYLSQYEGEAKSVKTEGFDFRALTRRILSEAGEDEDEGGGDEEAADAGGDDVGAEEPTKLTLEDIDMDSFANSVVRLIENYDNLLEVRSTLARRAKNFLAKSYDESVVVEYERTLREDHGIVAGETKMDVDAEQFPAPAADRAGGGGEGGAPPA
jgi:hypothetical protein